ncbi:MULTISPECIES: hypothetical protein [unclassified Neptuniibacter]|uniref:hypothetical protein n=1 Tax=unclassified Neptuniibacter TaxID=2630693 RepID=UPI000C5A953A|nr:MULTISPECIES: hypothetical protein [unclassified Neptuniibacter]MAY43013.1 hypothetical protein [Oceanospirillaceae bacterium]|tara:strand:- start:24248 stop:25099 length:852 start_codon:yes stop_codon:yes gene_type:complete
MRALAELVMKGRKQAAFVAVIAALLPLLYWVSAAVIALVALRKGPQDGAGVLVWAVLPAGAWAYSGDPTPLAVMVGVFILAVALRQAANWSTVLMVALPVGALAGVGLGLALEGLLGQVIEATEKFLLQSASQSTESITLDKEHLKLLLLGGLASVHTAIMLLCLILARSWQSGLYNPGGFQKEFHQLRLPLKYTGVLIGVLALSSLLDLSFMRWLPLMLLPWIFAGFALVHGSLAKRDLGRSWLIVFYLSVVLMGPYVITLLVFAAVIDSLVDIRARIPAKN